MGIRDRISEVESRYHQEFVDALEYLTEHPEVGLDEPLAVSYLTNLLKAHDFDLQRPFEGLDSAFTAEFRTGEGPKIAFLAKYDALPHFDKDGKDAHGCGHNWVAAWAVGTAICLSQLADYFKGTIAVVGSPAENFYGPEVKSLRSDYYKTCDLVCSTHLAEETLLHSFARPITALTLRIGGLAKQAFSWPEEGINSVDILVEILSRFKDIKDKGQEDDRINYLILNDETNISMLPSRSKLRLAIGAVDQARTDSLTEELLIEAQKICDKYGVDFTYEVNNRFEALHNITDLQEVIQSSFEDFQLDYQLLPKKLGRTQLDNAAIGRITPLLYFFFGVPHFSSHQPNVGRIAASHSKEAKEQLAKAIKIFADTSIKISEDKALRQRIRKKFEAKDFYHYTDVHQFKPYKREEG
ncbi:hypothetical protein D3H64_00165 [Atopobacter sp. AH10]|uniref:M20/M25/M40 family metallo-hydrolase n=1 Tax=Atopobacter sp. AH10 TaxID=2315861 RepID=UPI000EF2381E|nr:M20/M25/M40 family metallo-hydrolase [Atopobacter sp. AH10]RLK64227.1 hypothetical protein D3H64_00165 [Atopobacter sp. AH10]